MALQGSHFTFIGNKFEEKFGNRTIDQNFDKDAAIKFAEGLFQEAINRSLSEIYQKLQELAPKNERLNYNVGRIYSPTPISIEDFVNYLLRE